MNVFVNASHATPAVSEHLHGLVRPCSLVPEICFVDFAGDLTHTACGERCDLNYTSTTIFMQSVTCQRCQLRIQERELAAMAQPALHPVRT